ALHRVDKKEADKGKDGRTTSVNSRHGSEKSKEPGRMEEIRCYHPEAPQQMKMYGIDNDEDIARISLNHNLESNLRVDKMYSSVENNTGNVPAFLIKLWSLVEDPTTDDLIHWDTGGTSFHVYDQQRFSREILPLYFKHSNIASFIRQLNMYGFRKVTHIDQGGLKIEKDDLQFQHQFFQKGERDMLQFIKRKVSNPMVRPATEGAASPKSDEVSRVLTDVKQVKSKQDNMEENLEYIKRENKLLWREVALLRQKHHKQQQIVNKLIQFLVSLVSSNRTGLTIPGLRRMPLAINDTSQVQAQRMQQPVQAQVISDPGSSNSIASLLQDNLSGSSIVGLQSKRETQPGDDSDFIIDEGEYTIESPRGDVVLSPTPSSGGPIIHELTDVFPTTTVNVVQNVTQKPILISSQGQPVTLSGRQPGIILTTNQAQPVAPGNSNVPANFLYFPQLKAESQAQTISKNPSSSTLVTSKSSVGPQALFVPMSPKIEPGPSLQDALNFGLSAPSSNASASTKPLIAGPKVSVIPGNGSVSVLTPKKRPGESVSLEESSSSPLKKAMTVVAVAPTQTPIFNVPSGTATTSTQATKAVPLTQNLDISSSQYAPFDSLKLPVIAPSSSSAASSSVSTGSHNNGTDALAVAAAGNKKEGDDPLLTSEQLDILSSDLDGLKGILQDQYKVDPHFLLELFDMSNPWGIDAEKDLEDIKTDSDKDTASTSGADLGSVTGQELVEYNPHDNLFPDLLMGDSLVGDIEDID
ncbi:heat shock factor protein-like, partial [Plakobranchus ocellatus]